jgi:transcriptional regulator with XRE-family HTH domain
MGGAQAQLIGRKVRNRREAKGWRPEDLAHETGLGIKTVHRIESGQVERMRLNTAHRLATELDLDVEELRPPPPEDDPDIYELLAELLARVKRLERHQGVTDVEDDPGDSQDADAAVQAAAVADRETGRYIERSDRRRRATRKPEASK